MEIEVWFNDDQWLKISLIILRANEMVDNQLTFKFGVDDFVIDNIDDHTSIRGVDDEVTYRFVLALVFSRKHLFC